MECPKCRTRVDMGAEDGGRKRFFECGSWTTPETFIQSPGCRIRELETKLVLLTSENDRMSGELMVLREFVRVAKTGADIDKAVMAALNNAAWPCPD